MLCKYKDSLGVPREGVHARRMFDLAFWDIFGTIVISYAISRLFGVGFIITLIIILILAEALHLLFCVETPITKMIKLTASKFYDRVNI